ncbi:hypothetical protein D3C71_1766560 [compost metagenome]
MQPDSAAVSRQHSGKIDNLLPCFPARIRVTEEVDAFHFKSPPHGGPGGHRAVDAPGQQQHRLAVRTEREATCSLDVVAE